ncbi:MAG: response regulator, partial [Brevundimonas sp.]|nr:response regulator [Brevundimonas sp.]
TLFGVVLPLVRAQEREVEPDSTKPIATIDQVEASSIRVLFADDHEVNRTVVTMILEPLGVDLTVVENGQEAVDAAADTAFDLILMDVQMPVMDGLTATRQIRKMEGDRGLARTPIISLTANAMPDDVKRSLDAGSDRHLPKPIRPVDLVNAISNLLAEADENSGTAAAA